MSIKKIQGGSDERANSHLKYERAIDPFRITGVHMFEEFDENVIKKIALSANDRVWERAD